MINTQNVLLYDPKKYRILKVTPADPNDKAYYITQKRVMFLFWRGFVRKDVLSIDGYYTVPMKFDSFEAAQSALVAKIERRKHKTKKEVVYNV